MRFFFHLAGAVFWVACLQGCASSAPEASTNALLVPVVDKIIVDKYPASPAGQPGYPLSAEELRYDCKKLTGTMQIRILAIRDEQQRDPSTVLSRALNAALGGFSGSTTGADPEGRYAKDVAMLKAYNAQLAAKGCKTYDLKAELVPKDFRETPTPTIGGASKAKK